MDFNTLCNNRASVREYANTPIEEEKLAAVLEAARLAPSACNKQPWKFFVLKSEEAIEKAASCHQFSWCKTAPVTILCCIDHSREWIRPYDEKRHGNIDLAIAVEHICLAATEQGLGTCWICYFDAKLCKEKFELPEHLEPAVMIPIGYPKVEGTPKKRTSISNIVEVL